MVAPDLGNRSNDKSIPIRLITSIGLPDIRRSHPKTLRE
jgi:hypothetical protein